MLRIAGPGSEHDSLLDILQIERRDLGSTSLGSVESGSSPIGPRHKVVAKQIDVVVAHRSEQLLHRPHFGPIVDPELHSLDRQVAFDDTDLKSIGFDSLDPIRYRVRLGTWVTEHQIGHAALGREP